MKRGLRYGCVPVNNTMPPDSAVPAGLDSTDVLPANEDPAGKRYAASVSNLMKDRENSEKLVARIMHFSFAMLLHHRKILQEDAFIIADIEGIVRTYIMNPDHRIGLQVASKFAAAYEAQKLGYLKELSLVISNNDQDPNDAIEVFTWRVAYLNGSTTAEFLDNDGKILAQLTYLGEERMRNQVRELLCLIRRLCRECLSPLPSNSYGGLRISFNNRAPPYYMAPGFYETDIMYTVQPEAKSFIASNSLIATEHYGYLLSVRSVFLKNEDELTAKAGVDSVEHCEEENGYRDISCDGVEIPNVQCVVSPPRAVEAPVTEISGKFSYDSMEESRGLPFSISASPKNGEYFADLDANNQNDTNTVTVGDSNFANDMSGAVVDSFAVDNSTSCGHASLESLRGSSVATIGSHSSSTHSSEEPLKRAATESRGKRRRAPISVNGCGQNMVKRQETVPHSKLTRKSSKKNCRSSRRMLSIRVGGRTGRCDVLDEDAA